MDVGVRELKQHLSEYLARAEHGEVIRVTDRGRPKALLMPVPGGDPLQRGVDEGWIRPPLTDGGLEPFEGVGAERRTLDVLSDDRNG
jgi:prevent-host-death family protein